MRFSLFFILLCLFALTGKAQNPVGFRPGYYIDLNGEVHPGMINYGFDYRKKIKFRPDGSGKVETLRPNQLRGFVLEADSFIVLKNFMNEGAAGGEHYIDADFVKVLETGPITLVKHYSTQGSGSMQYGGGTIGLETYLLIKAPSTSATLVKKRKKRFKETMMVYFQDSPEIVTKIAQEEYTQENIQEMVQRYNKEALSKAKQ